MADGDGIRPVVAGGIEAISSNEECRYFTLRDLDPSLNEAEMVGIAEALSQSTHVEEINLSGSLEGSPTMATSTFLNKIFETHPSITEINLSWGKLSNHFAEVIGLALKTNKSLKVLNVYRNNIGPSGAQALADGLSQNRVLQVLCLACNQVGDEGATSLAEALLINKTLEKLYLGINHLTSNGAIAFASALEKSSLKKLYLNSNPGIEDQGGEAIAKSLCKNKSLSDLYLNNTGIGNKTCKALALALCENSTLTELDMVKNRITNTGAKAFGDTLQHLNYAIEELRLYRIDDADDRISNRQLRRIQDLCRRNIRVKAFFQQVNQNIPAIQLGVWPRILETVECKPDLLFALLKTKPDLCQGQQPNQH